MLRKRLHPVSTNNPVDLFTNLPQEITIDILSRLPVGSIVRCKCVCKSWRDLIESSEFVTMHLSKSTSSSGLALIDQDVESPNPYRSCNEVSVDGCTPISNFVLPTYPRTTELCSANGLLLLFDGCTVSDHNLFICNPITREYIRVPLPPDPVYEPCKAIFGFGASKVTGEYKVVIICEEGMVYSLQSESWRVIAAPILKHDRVSTAAALLNGNLHWLGCDPKLLISCFDLETEQFTSFHLPPYDYDGRYYLSALEGRLCFSDINVDHDKIDIWFMNIYGDGNAGTKEYTINTLSLDNHLNCRKIFPLKVFRDRGDILFEVECCEQLFFYSNETKSIREYAGNLQVRASYTSSIVSYSPSFLSLKAMGLKDVACMVLI